ncbi:hypothetical protein NF27_CY00070 [Candidatus Jidaibacter acanthamoeba]|uniref:Uncharacterized protein n=1 Tax=Candidatus Jidaibacter acanthamoebae TaxID=86105 RepID=A0A0C1N0D0_9RICK|nr:hypothetical protein [Candidatus Jidaibacter acanthamoeba]KIE05771.1 hypothetical protein NF27_CY00070 [Candidatus Jidaibacter acanthamoeba]
MKISIKELELAFLRIISHLENNDIKEFGLKHDYYWQIHKEQCYDVSKKPDVEEFTLGQLTWDIERAVKRVKDEEDEYVMAYDLVFLSTLMRAIGEEISAQSRNELLSLEERGTSMREAEYTKISIEKLKIGFLKVMRYLEEDGIKEFTLSNDYYWYIPKEQYYIPEERPKAEELKIGQLSSDIEKMRRIANDKDEPIPNDLMWLSAIMRALGEEIFV